MRCASCRQFLTHGLSLLTMAHHQNQSSKIITIEIISVFEKPLIEDKFQAGAHNFLFVKTSFSTPRGQAT
jgi:hypothetical protein